MKAKQISYIANSVLSLAVICLYILHFNTHAEKSKQPASGDSTAVAKPAVANNSTEGMKIAYFNTDSVWKNYQYVKDMEEELISEKQKLENKYNNQLKQLEKEYKEFQKKAQAMEYTMEEGKRKQEELMAKEQNIYKLENELNQKYAESEAKKTKEIRKEITRFIQEYNREKGYLLILGQSFATLPYADSTLDITTEILNGLNKKYAAKKISATNNSGK